MLLWHHWDRDNNPIARRRCGANCGITYTVDNLQPARMRGDVK